MKNLIIILMLSFLINHHTSAQIVDLGETHGLVIPIVDTTTVESPTPGQMVLMPTTYPIDSTCPPHCGYTMFTFNGDLWFDMSQVNGLVLDEWALSDDLENGFKLKHKASGYTGVQLIPGDGDTMSVVMGGPGNSIFEEEESRSSNSLLFGPSGATVSGGSSNKATNFHATVSGGKQNRASGRRSTVSGGLQNTANGVSSTVSGGRQNIAGGDHTVISGGGFNETIGIYGAVGGGIGNEVKGDYGTVSGGNDNDAIGDNSTVSGGFSNQATNVNSTIGGGNDNDALGDNSTVGGGKQNQATGHSSTVSGGFINQATNMNTTIGGGNDNEATGRSATVSGGIGNGATGDFTTISGGANNHATGAFAAIPGGADNSARGESSFAAGQLAQANHDLSFVWNSPLLLTDTFSSSGISQFLINAPGGVGIGTNTPTNQLTVLGTIEIDGPSNGLIFSDGTEQKSSGWQLNGNVGTAGLGILGTTDNFPFSIFANNIRTYFFIPALFSTDAPSIIGGYKDNEVLAHGGTISGGGSADGKNSIIGNYGTIGGGLDNRASLRSAVGGGRSNVADGSDATVAGGISNNASANSSTVGGGEQNMATGLNSIVGGGKQNQATGLNATVGGGKSNDAQEEGATIAGGQDNMVTQPNSSIGGGVDNKAQGVVATISGGSQNTAGMAAAIGGRILNWAIGEAASVGGGRENVASGVRSTIPGGEGNIARGSHSLAAGIRAIANHNYSFVWNDGSGIYFDSLTSTREGQFLVNASGGTRLITDTLCIEGMLKVGPIGNGIMFPDSTVQTTAAIGGGGGSGWSFTGDAINPGEFLGTTNNEPLEFLVNNVKALRLLPTLSGFGPPNVIGGDASNGIINVGTFGATIAGGSQNMADTLASIGGGEFNNAQGIWSTIAGGNGNFAIGEFSMITGGINNRAEGDYSFASGSIAEALHDGSFVWQDASMPGLALQSSAANQFIAKAAGGTTFYSDAGGATGVTLAPGSGSWTSASSVRLKTDFDAVDGEEILDKLNQLEIRKWRYKAEADNISHIGPTSQDFQKAFGLGSTDEGISTVDADGVAMAAIKELYKLVQEQANEIAELKTIIQNNSEK